ncbi:MAG: LytR C-terminal domain-containing protein [Cyanobacteria bacterium NC_groundwater_1444_Ag_S-0.65um_54_12]|nr:LytR C-terminal domain-containing protein [Cyanobacteria bacterium NC_groundwater_1444_Ag_S-0.65um_54_12]
MRLAAKLLSARATADETIATQPIRSATHIAVLNGTKRARLASEAARLLRADGWTVWFVGTANSTDYATSQIIGESGSAELREAIAGSLNLPTTTGGQFALSHNLPFFSEKIDYVVILGEDFLRSLRLPLRQGG